jgi:hypothetical protein
MSLLESGFMKHYVLPFVNTRVSIVGDAPRMITTKLDNPHLPIMPKQRRNKTFTKVKPIHNPHPHDRQTNHPIKDTTATTQSQTKAPQPNQPSKNPPPYPVKHPSSGQPPPHPNPTDPYPPHSKHPVFIPAPPCRD